MKILTQLLQAIETFLFVAQDADGESFGKVLLGGLALTIIGIVFVVCMFLL